MKYYHVTRNDKKIIDSILKNGLLSDEGEIFLFQNYSIVARGISNYVSCLIAGSQLFLDEYAMFEIDAEGLVELVHDDVAESTKGTTWIAKQHKINPEHIKLYGRYITDVKPWFLNID